MMEDIYTETGFDIEAHFPTCFTDTALQDPSGLKIFLLGRTGVGKSASGNTILGTGHFRSKPRAELVTRECELGTGEVAGRPVCVLDTPDTQLLNEEHMLQNIRGVFLRAQEVHALLLVLPVGDARDTHRGAQEMIQDLFGPQALRYTIVLFTRGEDLEGETVQEYVQSQSRELQSLVEQCVGRTHVFCNKNTADRSQVAQLLDKIEALVRENGGGLHSRTPDSPIELSEPRDLRIVLLGKTGCGKSRTGNTILKQDVFQHECSPKSITHECQWGTGTVEGRKVTVVDTPGFFDTELPQGKLRREIGRCIAMSSPGPHAFLLVIQLGRQTPEEKRVVSEILRLFGQKALRFALVLFTHGDSLGKGTMIEEFFEKNDHLTGLIEKCGGRYHIFDNEDKSSRTQVRQLLAKIEAMVQQNEDAFYTNRMYQEVENRIRTEAERILNTLVLYMPRTTGRHTSGGDEPEGRAARLWRWLKEKARYLAVLFLCCFPCFMQNTEEDDSRQTLLRNDSHSTGIEMRERGADSEIRRRR